MSLNVNVMNQHKNNSNFFKTNRNKFIIYFLHIYLKPAITLYSGVWNIYVEQSTRKIWECNILRKNIDRLLDNIEKKISIYHWDSDRIHHDVGWVHKSKLQKLHYKISFVMETQTSEHSA